jgi:prepilin-type N-terminal cleavage/methylation domain-containing protein
MLSRNLSKPRNGEKGFTLIELIIVIVILGIIAGVAIPKFVGLSDQARKSAARGVAGAMSSTIAGKHATFLIEGTAYTCAQVITDTQFESGVAAPSFADPTVTWISGPNTYTWTYFTNAGDTSAYITEASGFVIP